MKRKWVVCSAWPYVNDKPHLGTFIHLLSADVYARYLRLKGEDVALVSGSDEHGTPIEVEALARGITPRKLTSEYHRVFQKSLRAFNIEFDNYTRTESPVHKKFVREFYLRLDRNGYVFAQNVVLPYCETDKRFLPDRFVEGECPNCHFPNARGDQCDNCGRILEPKDLIKPYCVLDHSTPVLRESQHWFFDLPRLRLELEKYVKENTNFPENARNFSLAWIREGLKPRSLTRDNKWGIKAPFPGADNKTIYVWMEAVLGYVSATKEWAEKKRKQPNLWKKYWFGLESRNIHFIGKDNIPFHTVIFPGLLLATRQRYRLPWEVSSTEYIQFEGQKFSKSRKVGIWIDEALQLETSEYWRYALISLRPELKDTNFTWEEFERKVNTELNDALGNFVHRTITFALAQFKRVPNFNPSLDADAEIFETQAILVKNVNEALESYRLKEALEEIVQLARAGNRYLNQREPWKSIKTDPASAGQSIAVAIQLVASIGLLLQPFLPETSGKILSGFFGKKHPDWSRAGQKNLVKSNQKISSLPPLFHKVSASILQSKLARLRGDSPIEIET